MKNIPYILRNSIGICCRNKEYQQQQKKKKKKKKKIRIWNIVMKW